MKADLRLVRAIMRIHMPTPARGLPLGPMFCSCTDWNDHTSRPTEWNISHVLKQVYENQEFLDRCAKTHGIEIDYEKLDDPRYVDEITEGVPL